MKLPARPTASLMAILSVIALLGCSSAVSVDESSGCSAEGLLESFVTPEGLEVFIYADGTARTNDAGICTFVLQYFDPDFLAKNYVTNGSVTFLISNEGDLFPTKNDFARSPTSS